METIMQINRVVNDFVWGPPDLTLLVGTGVYLTFLLGMPQLRYFLPAVAEVLRFRRKGEGMDRSRPLRRWSRRWRRRWAPAMWRA